MNGKQGHTRSNGCSLEKYDFDVNKVLRTDIMYACHQLQQAMGDMPTSHEQRQVADSGQTCFSALENAVLRHIYAYLGRYERESKAALRHTCRSLYL
eukprot:scaffold264282_cov18-Tisochrysis_lutea.AAC.2